ncbi:MAG: hypothetical protein DRH12_08590 [Deltaproteobacteria bacterium]|nr:MAG: hypothetical protein DRH12_08590 [Deltaproteobacteria bacterium]
MKKKMFSTQVRNDLLKEFKKLAIDLERPINDVLEEAMLDLLVKYGVGFHPAGSDNLTGKPVAGDNPGTRRKGRAK